MDHMKSEYTGDVVVDEYYAAYEYADATNNSGNKHIEFLSLYCAFFIMLRFFYQQMHFLFNK